MSHNVSAGKTTDVAYSIGIFLIVYYCHLSPRKGDETHIYTPTSCSISPTPIRAGPPPCPASHSDLHRQGLTHAFRNL